MADAVHAWEAAVLDAAEGLLDRTDVLAVFGAGLWERRTAATADRCAACTGPLTRTTLADPLTGHESLRHDCRNCGSKRLGPDSTVRLTVTGDALVVTGTDSGRVLVSCAYKGFPAAATTRHDVAEHGRRVALPTPDGIPDELLATTRTVRVVLVDGAAVHVWKERL